jgi:FlaG/FlaF family flagellin (archaellin)
MTPFVVGSRGARAVPRPELRYGCDMTRSFLLAVLVACGPKATPPSTPVADSPAPTSPAQTSPMTADGKHFATERVYEGRCAPAGSRGGCVTITLRPDGSYHNVQYDMAIDGTYTIDDHTLNMTGPDMGEQMTFSPDFEQLGDLTLKR